MQLTSFFSLALALAVSVTAVPTFSPEARELSARTGTVDNDDSSALASGSVLLEARKPKWEKVPLTISKNLEAGVIKQNQVQLTEELGQKALYQAGELTGGAVVCGWHDLHSEDPVEHFTIQPKQGKAGRIHVHHDGSWTQGKGKKQKSGDGRV